jgi:hypothetical protein
MILFLCQKGFMKRNLLTAALILLMAGTGFGQTAMRAGITLGSSVAWPADLSGLNSGFFTVSRAGFQGGLVNTLTFADRLVFRLGVNANMQSYAIRQTGVDKYRFDARIRSLNLEIPLQFGFTGYLGSLRHREMIGASLQTNLSASSKIVQQGDSVAVISPAGTVAVTQAIYPVITAAFEIGSEFDNDGALFFGACIRYGFQETTRSNVSSNFFPAQQAAYNGTYLGFGLTFYFPRYSYWFKREFIY